MNHGARAVIAAAISVLSLPAISQAQTIAPGVLQVQEMDNGFVIAPDARFTKINDRAATLAGVYAGWQTDRTFVAGAGFYWLANRDDDFKVQYGGGLFRWNFGGRRKVGLSAGALVGFGDATLSRTYGDIFGLAPGTVLASPSRYRGGRVHSGSGKTITSDTRVLVSDMFFVTEPQVTALWTIAPWARLDAGVGYRFIGGSDLLGDQLRGVSGTVAVQFSK